MKLTVVLILLGAIVISSFIVLSIGNNAPKVASRDNVSIIDGKQTITIHAKGGYTPRMTIAKANIPTVIKMSTRGTFDCSSFLVIPELGFRSSLPIAGETMIDVPPQQPGKILQGLCAMGMYNFAIKFE